MFEAVFVIFRTVHCVHAFDSELFVKNNNPHKLTTNQKGLAELCLSDTV